MIILYAESPKDSSKKNKKPKTKKTLQLLELINKFCEVAGYKNNIQRSLEFLHTNTKLSEKEMKKQLHLQ